MGMHWPSVLLLLGFLPVIVGLYLWILHRRRRYALRYSSLSLLRLAMPNSSSWRRHLPFFILLLALSSLIVALARPVAIISVPSGRATIILAMDVSRSMCSTDIAPNRLRAAEDAALSFVQSQRSNIQIGIVAFAGFAEQVLLPTADQELLEDAIESLITGRRTAIGNGILEALDSIAEIDETVAPSASINSDASDPTPVPQGVYVPNIIVLLTDGANNSGPEPLEAARQAADRGVRVYTIGYGTEQGGVMDCGEPYFRQGFFGGGGGGMFTGGGGGRYRRGIDEPTLIEVAEMTGGTYFSAESADELQEVFRNLPTDLITRNETTEISVIFAALGGLLALAAISLSLLRNPLP